MIDLSVKNLVKSYDVDQNILDGLSFDIQSGERVGIMGRNGQRRFESKEACVEHLAELLGKYRAKGRVTLVQISRVYCASHQKWVRGVSAYMKHINDGKWGQI